MNFYKGNNFPFNTVLDKIDLDILKSSKEKINYFSNNKNKFKNLYCSTEDNKINQTPKIKNVLRKTNKLIHSIEM